LAPASKPRRQNALGPKLSCSFQAAGSGAFGPAVAGVRDSVRRLPDVARGSAEDSRDEPRATSSGCRGRSDDIPDLLRAFVGDSRRVAGVGTPVGYRRLAVDGRENEENYTCSRDSSRSGSRRLLRDPDESLRNNQTASNVQILETYLEFVLRPCQRALVDHWLRPTPPIMAPFFTGVNIHRREHSAYPGEKDELLSSLIAQNESAIIIPSPPHNAATGERIKATRPSPITGRPVDETGRSFEPLIGSAEAARLLGNIHVKTLQRYARLGTVPGYQIGGHWYFRASDLDDWLQTQINSKSPTR
jgi:excisionase family DNA binding protein